MEPSSKVSIVFRDALRLTAILPDEMTTFVPDRRFGLAAFIEHNLSSIFLLG